MNPQWQEFLQNSGAEIENNQVTSFGNPIREQRMVHTGLIICDLSHQGLISVEGDDAADFLQGQLTNDIRNVSEQHSQLSAYCTHKGRMLANFRIFKRGDAFFLRLPLSVLETAIKRISMFVLMSKVIIKDSSLNLIKIGVSGPKANVHLNEILGNTPQEVDGTIHKMDSLSSCVQVLILAMKLLVNLMMLKKSGNSLMYMQVP